MGRRAGCAAYAVVCLAVMVLLVWWLPEWLEGVTTMAVFWGSIFGAAWIYGRRHPVEVTAVTLADAGAPSGPAWSGATALDPARVPVPGPAEARSPVRRGIVLSLARGVGVPALCGWAALKVRSGEFVADPETGPLWFLALIWIVLTAVAVRGGLALAVFTLRLHRASRRIGAGGEPRLAARVVERASDALVVVPLSPTGGRGGAPAGGPGGGPAGGPDGEPLALWSRLSGLRRVHVGDEVVVDGRPVPGSVVAVTSSSRRVWVQVCEDRRSLLRGRLLRGPGTPSPARADGG